MKKVLPILLIVALIGFGFWFYKSYLLTKSIKNVQTQKENKVIDNSTILANAQLQTNESSADIFPLKIITPINKSIVHQPSVTLSGNTAVNATVYVNENEHTADEQGNFSAAINLDEGENTIYIMAHDNLGNSSQQEITVTLESL